jgi:hypothetical protein
MSNIIATLCLLGKPAKSREDNDIRLEILEHALNVAKTSLHTIVLPGGMFFHDEALAPLPPSARIDVLNACPEMQALSQIVGNNLIVSGLDIYCHDEVHGQYSFALSKDGVKAVSRKVFPTKKEVQRGLAIQAQDFSDSSRITENQDCRVIMHSCYDIFGSVDALTGKEAPSRLSHVPAPAHASKSACYNDYKKVAQIAAKGAPIVTVNIHEFAKPGRDIFYQRHGLATASAAFNGAPVFAAAHFEETLPQSAAQSPLAANGVPTSHIKARFHRQAHALTAKEAIPVKTASMRGIIRIFEI